MENDFSNEKYFRCGQCMYRTVRKHNLKRHTLKMHTESKRILECCGLVFQTKSVLREHMTRFHENGYMCLICRRLFQRKALLTRHLTVHGGRKEFHCSVCTYETSHKSNLQRHQKVHRKKLAAHVKGHKSSDKTSGLSFSAYQGDCVTCKIGKISEDADFGNRHGYSTYPMHGNISPYSRSAEKGDDLFYTEKKSPLAAMAELSILPQSILGCYARNYQYEKHSYFNPSVEMMVTSNQALPFYGNEASCLGYRPEPEQTEKFIEFEKRSLVKGNTDVKLVKNDDGKEIESSSAIMKQPRLCHYPYKCNFCSCRFGSQHELCHHNTVCTF